VAAPGITKHAVIFIAHHSQQCPFPVKYRNPENMGTYFPLVTFMLQLFYVHLALTLVLVLIWLIKKLKGEPRRKKPPIFCIYHRYKTSEFASGVISLLIEEVLLVCLTVQVCW
jgi:hypothetical protein